MRQKQREFSSSLSSCPMPCALSLSCRPQAKNAARGERPISGWTLGLEGPLRLTLDALDLALESSAGPFAMVELRMQGDSGRVLLQFPEAFCQQAH